MQDLDALKSEIIGRIDGADTLDALDALRVSELGKKGRVSLMMRELGGMDPDARKALRASGSIPPSSRIISDTRPFLPSSLTRNASSASSVSAPSIRPMISDFSASKSCMVRFLLFQKIKAAAPCLRRCPACHVQSNSLEDVMGG